jgi:hypothetical protein
MIDFGHLVCGWSPPEESFSVDKFEFGVRARGLSAVWLWLEFCFPLESSLLAPPWTASVRLQRLQVSSRNVAQCEQQRVPDLSK